MTVTTYTLVNSTSGEPEYSGLTAVEAAQQRLWHDGGAYEMRRLPEADTGTQCWALWTRRGQNPWSRDQTGCPGNWKTAIAWAVDAEAAFAALADDINESEWDDLLDVMTDVEYARQEAEFEQGSQKD